MSFVDDFDGPDLDRDSWLPHYLPHWSSRAESAATYDIDASELRLTIPPGQRLWCPDTHATPLRVSGLQSGVVSGQQPFRAGLEVREHQEAWWGVTPTYGRIEVRARMELSPRSMASVWMVGIEDEPHRCGEICIFEIFGDALDGGSSAAVGMGIHPFRDPALIDMFEAARLPIDVREPHDYAADWRPDRVEFSVDGQTVRTVEQAPDYPMQFMVAVFDFPRIASHADHVPLFAVDRIRVAP
ncbi:MAG TPA: glycoside hydrolase family 16 protein [Solirubrobacteraceae bacterium]|nr:glycoside hydrolase family 16 protein [Solirubrobacteraceae bacterium]